MLKDFIQKRIKIDIQSNSIETLCGICSTSTTCFDILKDTFTNLDDLKSRFICAECAPLFSGEWLKTAFYFTKTELKKMKQGEFENLIFNHKLEFPCILSFSESRKKHRLFRSKISYSDEEIYISTDLGMVILNLRKDRKLFENLKKMYQWKFSKETIKNGNYNSGYFKKYNISVSDFLICENYLKQFRNTLKFNLLLQFINQ